MGTLVPVGYEPLIFLAADSSFSYYHITRTLYKIARGAEFTAYGNETQIVQYASGDSIRQVWTTDTAGELFILILLAAGTYVLHRSTDYGSTSALVYTLPANSYILERGFTVGTPASTRTLAFVEYTVDAGSVNTTLQTSTDGTTWGAAWSLRGGATGTDIRHFHSIVWDEWSSCFWITTGDAGTSNAHCFILKWDGTTSLTNDTGAAALDGLGFTILYGSQHYRTVGVVPTKDYIYWGVDTHSGSTGGVSGDKGIWRATKDLATVEHCDLGDGRYDTYAAANSRSTMWTGVFYQDSGGTSGVGHVLFISSMNTAVSGQQFESIFMAHTDDAGANAWREVGRIYIQDSQVNVDRALNTEGTDIFWSFTRGAVKGVNGETAIFRIDANNPFRADVTTGFVEGEGLNYTAHQVPILHAVQWMDSVNGNNANSGDHPADAYKTSAGVPDYSKTRVLHLPL